jgi:hypothetical protein
MNAKTSVEMFSELVRLGHVSPATGPLDLVMPTAYRSVPSVLVYNTPAAPLVRYCPV